mmetsp:Transcript_48018/g.85717  ORF Transcript_48018/g.85717 Transcript_48018/m.85717 type:complete len:98 (-) Transcript_48018:307-600(-)
MHRGVSTESRLIASIGASTTPLPAPPPLRTPTAYLWKSECMVGLDLFSGPPPPLVPCSNPPSPTCLLSVMAEVVGKGAVSPNPGQLAAFAAQSLYTL